MNVFLSLIMFYESQLLWWETGIDYISIHKVYFYIINIVLIIFNGTVMNIL